MLSKLMSTFIEHLSVIHAATDVNSFIQTLKKLFAVLGHKGDEHSLEE